MVRSRVKPGDIEVGDQEIVATEDNVLIDLVVKPTTGDSQAHRRARGFWNCEFPCLARFTPNRGSRCEIFSRPSGPDLGIEVTDDHLVEQESR